MQIQKQFDKPLNYNKIPDSKRQQTTTVDYKRLINGFFLTSVVSLQREINSVTLWKKNNQKMNCPSSSRQT